MRGINFGERSHASAFYYSTVRILSTERVMRLLHCAVLSTCIVPHVLYTVFPKMTSRYHDMCTTIVRVALQYNTVFRYNLRCPSHYSNRCDLFPTDGL